MGAILSKKCCQKQVIWKKDKKGRWPYRRGCLKPSTHYDLNKKELTFTYKSYIAISFADLLWKIQHFLKVLPLPICIRAIY